MPSQIKPFTSPHFMLEEIGSGVFAAVHKPGGSAIANAGIVDLGDQTLVFDTFISHIAALDLRAAAEHLTGKPVTHVINSHYHSDHIRGNQVFSDAKIVAANKTVNLIKTDGEQELAWDQGSEKRYKDMLRQREDAENEDPDPILDFYIHYFRVISESLPGLKLRLPDITFKEQLSFEDSTRKVELYCYSGGHTGSDAILYLPGDGIAFAADLLFVRCHPFLTDGDPQAWLDHLDKIKNLDLEIIVPGHGAVGTPTDLELIQNYIQALVQMIDTAVTNGESLEAVEKMQVPPQFGDWEFESFFSSNIRFLYSERSENTQTG